MDKTYTPAAIERIHYMHWEEQSYFKPRGYGQNYCIMLPPPNVTGSLHMGHGFQHTLIDAMIRYHRMMGDCTLWQPGTDHAGISTQLIVEAQLEKNGRARKDMTRAQFLDHVWAWKEQSGGDITQQMRRIGSSADWSRERFTMDASMSLAVQKVFIELYNEGLIYRGVRLVNWDIKLGTAISDLEVIAQEEEGFIWHINYPLVDTKEMLTVATTRPETLLGDSAIAVHPDDIRYQHLIGKHVHLPLCNRIIPIIADHAVLPDFGSGCVKITPAHDFNDYEVGKRHQLPQLNILSKTGLINENAPIKYQGMERFAARAQIIQDLSDLGLLVQTIAHKLKIPRGEKSNDIIEPMLTEQWYVKTTPLAQPAIDAVKNGAIRFVPEHWTETYFQWMENIEDWCISRQLWWGHRIPAWYDEQGKIFVGSDEADVRLKYNIDETTSLKQDEDVLDTWFSSALWPFSTLGWPKSTTEFTQFYPTTVLFTGFDIIFFWIARMVMLGLKFTAQVPFKEVVITGLICDHDGKKMSKSKGNVIDPIDVIDGIGIDALIAKRTNNLMLNSVRTKIIADTRKQFPEGIAAYGADALRFTFCAMPANTRIARFDMKRVESYRNFCNKLWNAARFVLLSTTEENIDLGDGAFQYSQADLWINSKLQHLITRAHMHFNNYRLDLLTHDLYEFIWHEYCDWYLELAKFTLYDKNASGAMKRGTRYTLVKVLEQILKLIHPIMPFISEEIWQRTSNIIADNPSSTIMLSPYPKADAALIDLALEEEFIWLKQIIQAIRTIRSEIGISPAQAIALNFRNISVKIQIQIDKYTKILSYIAKLSSINCLAVDAIASESASAMVGTLELLIPMAGIIDKNSELERLHKELAKLAADILFISTKLNNKSFSDKAPATIIAKEQEKLMQAQLTQDKLSKHYKMIQGL